MNNSINFPLLMKRLLLLCVDGFSILIALVLSLGSNQGTLFHFSSFFNIGYAYLFIIFLKLAFFYICKLYNNLWRYSNAEDLLKVIGVVTVSLLMDLVYFELTSKHYTLHTYLLICIATISLMIIARIARVKYNGLKSNTDAYSPLQMAKKVMIVGGGLAGVQTIKDIQTQARLNREAVVVIDDDVAKQGKEIRGVLIAGGCDRIPEIAENYKVEEIVIAMPSVNKTKISQIVEYCSETECKVKILPSISDIMNGTVNVNKIRNIDIHDLLGREELLVDCKNIGSCLKEEVVLVTGGGGSIGSKLCREIVKFKPKLLIIFDIYENNAYDLQQELLRKYKNEISLQVIIGSVRDSQALNEVFNKYKPGIVYHAAAHKHVPLMEDCPNQAIKNNIFGTLTLVEAAHRHNVKRFVMISSDKAVNPTNIMGATKRVAELIIQYYSRISKTKFVGVRFGNVLGSNGSVIPLFKKQIEEGGPVTITHPEIKRYFMTIPEASKLVLQASSMAKGGEIFILDMGTPIKIYDLALKMIKFSGLKLGQDIDIEITGLRPGEKLYEELILDEEPFDYTDHSKIFVAKPVHIEESFIEDLFDIKLEMDK